MADITSRGEGYPDDQADGRDFCRAEDVLKYPADEHAEQIDDRQEPDDGQCNADFLVMIHGRMK